MGELPLVCSHTVEYDLFIQSSLARTRLTFGPCVVHLWSGYHLISGGETPLCVRVVCVNLFCIGYRKDGKIPAHLKSPSSFPRLSRSERSRGSSFGFRVLRFGCRVSGFGFRVSGLGPRDSGHGSRVSGFESRILGFGFGVSGFGFRVEGLEYRVSGFGFRVSGFGFRVLNFGFRASVIGYRVLGFGFLVSDLGNSLALRVREVRKRFHTPGWSLLFDFFGKKLQFRILTVQESSSSDLEFLRGVSGR